MATWAERRSVGPALGRAAAWVVVLAAAAVAARYGYGRYEASRAAAAPPQYFLQPASVGPVVETVNGDGTLLAPSTTTVTAQVAGTVAAVDVQVGQEVRAGQTLFTMSDTSGLGVQLAAAEAALQAAQQNLNQLQDPALATDPRTLQLDQLQVQQAQLTLQDAEANLQQAEAAAAAAASLAAPVAGTIQAVDVVDGQQVTPGTVVAVVQPAGAPTVTVSVPQAELPYLPTGTTANVVSSALGVTATGTVTGLGSPEAPAPSSTARGGSSIPSSTAAGAAPDVYPLTLSLSGVSGALPAGADVTVTFQPQGNPPPSDAWSDGGSVTYPAPVDVTAGQAGVVSGLVQAGAAVGAGQRLATVTPPDGDPAVTQDQDAVQQDQDALQQAQDNLQAAQSPQPPSAATLAAAEERVALDQAAVATDRQEVADLTVTAPSAGTVQALAVEPGAALRAGAAALTLQGSGPLQAEVDVDELDVAKVHAGQTATVTVPAYPTQTFRATVTAIAPTAVTQFGVAYFPVSLAVQGLPAGSRAGMTLQASILIQQVASALRVPAWAVTALGGSNRGLVRVMEGGRPTPVVVSLGVTSGRWDQVLSGLRAGAEVIAGDTAAASSTRPGAFFFAGGGGGLPQGPGGGGPGGR